MRALITGISSGIGASIATFLQQSGWHIIGIDHQPPIDQSIEYYALDLSQINDCVQFTQQFNTPVDAFIHCAGIREICDPCELSADEWMRVLNINLNSAFLLSQAVIRTAISTQKKLGIIHVASISGIQAESDRAAYVTSKFGLIGLTKQLALQYGSLGIRTNAIAPGVIETPLTQAYFSDEALVHKIKSNTPVGHWGQVEHILPIVQLLLTNEYMNGSVVVCDGGWTSGKNI